MNNKKENYSRLYIIYLPHKLKLEDDTAQEAYEDLIANGYFYENQEVMFTMLEKCLGKYIIASFRVHRGYGVFILANRKQIEKIRKSKKFMVNL
jgi:hypothetical protein